MSASLQQLEMLFTAAVALPGGDRAEFLARTCGADAALRTRVEGMLRTNDSLGGFLETTVAPGFAETATGARIGRYLLREKLGEGGVGVVFLAEQAEPVRRKVALKVIKPGMDSREVIARFESERQALALMDHPYIARVFDAGATPLGQPFFVMELVNGPPLTRFCDEQRLTLESRLGLFVKVCLAIQHAHEKGIIHRDIKSSNILVASHDGEHLPKVIDFGIAKATGFTLTEKTLLTVHPRFMGTPASMSPEQAAEAGGEIDARSDVYSLGVLLCELLVGRTPLGPIGPGVGVAEMRRRICEESPLSLTDLLDARDSPALRQAAEDRATDPTALREAVAGAVSWIALRCLAKERADRYPSARALAEDVQRHLSHEAVEVKPPALLTNLKNQLRRHGAARWLGATAAAAVDGFSSRRQETNQGAPPPLRTINVEAHRLVLEGRRNFNEFTEEGFKRAEAAFRQALEVGPGYTAALVGLAYVAGRRAILSVVASRHIEGTLATAERYARETLAGDGHVAEAYAVLGAVGLVRGRWIEAARQLEQALGVNPNSELAWFYLSRLHMCRGRPDLALPLLENARLLVSGSGSGALHRAPALLLSRRHSDALAVCDEAEQLGHASALTWAYGAVALLGLARKEAALAKARGALDPALRGELTAGMRALGDGLAAWALASGGARAEAGDLVAAILRLPEEHHFTAGFATAALGDPAQALELLGGMPHWLIDHLFLFEQETGLFHGLVGFERLLRQLSATEGWQSLRRMDGGAA